MIDTDLLPLPLGSTVLVTSVNDYDIPTGTLATVVHHLDGLHLDPDVAGWPIIAWPSHDPESLTVQSMVCNPAALTLTANPPRDPDTTVTVDVAAHVLYHFEGTGYRPGGFISQLINTITHADPINRARLALGYPAYVQAVELASRHPNGLAQLHTILRGEQ